jgi:hypothetical protein
VFSLKGPVSPEKMCQPDTQAYIRILYLVFLSTTTVVLRFLEFSSQKVKTERLLRHSTLAAEKRAKIQV